jgi:hypothetical protein
MVLVLAADPHGRFVRGCLCASVANILNRTQGGHRPPICDEWAIWSIKWWALPPYALNFDNPEACAIFEEPREEMVIECPIYEKSD